MFSIFINLLLLGPTLYMLQVYDRVLSSRSVPTLFMLTVGVCVALLAMTMVDFARGQLLAMAGRHIDEMLGKRVLRRVIANASAIGRNGYVHGLKDVATLRGFLTGSNIIAMFDAPWLPCFVLLIFLFHPSLGVVALAGAIILLGLAWLNEKTNRKELQRLQEATRQAGQFIDQGLRNADVLNSMGMGQAFASKWENLNQDVLDRLQGTNRRMGSILAASKFVRQAIQILMMGLGAYLVIHDNLSAGVMIASTILLGRAMAPVENLIGNWNGLVAARLAYDRLGKMLPHLFEDSSSQILPTPQGHLRAENLSLAGLAPDKPILHQVRFELEAGKSIAILGPSGSGKSSLAKVIAGVWTPSLGHVRIDGADIRQWNEGQLARCLGYLPQDVELFSGTVAENIGRFDVSNGEAIVQAAQAAHAYELILRLPQGFETRLGEGGIQLSAGQAQRIGLARALYGQPRILVLDEPNANLDAEGEFALLKTLEALRTEKVTVVLITHKPSLVTNIDYLLIMREGRVESIGTRDEVLARLNGQSNVVAVPSVRAAHSS